MPSHLNERIPIAAAAFEYRENPDHEFGLYEGWNIVLEGSCTSVSDENYYVSTAPQHALQLANYKDNSQFSKSYWICLLTADILS